MGAASGNLVDEIFGANNSVFAKSLLNDIVSLELDSLSVQLSSASLVHEFSDGFLSAISISNVGFNSSDHVHGGFVDSNEHGVVKLLQSQQLHDLSAFRV